MPSQVAISYAGIDEGFVPISTIAGYRHSCTLSEDGRVTCWGSNQEYQLGLGTILSSTEGPESAVDLGDDFFVIQLAAGNEHNCAMSLNREIKCWGRYAYICSISSQHALRT